MTMHRLVAALPSLVAVVVSAAPCAAQNVDAIPLLLRRVEQVVQSGDSAAYLALLADSASRSRALDFSATELLPGCVRAAVQERDREPLRGVPTGYGYRLMLDVFSEFSTRGRVATWRLDVKRMDGPGRSQEWAIADEERISLVENLFRVALSSTKQYTARNLTIRAEDLDLTLPDGSVFVADIDAGVTALVLLGHGTVNFHPAPQTEKGQVRIFCGKDALEASFDSVYLRVSPSDFDDVVARSDLQPVAVDAHAMRRAQDIFRDESAKSFIIDLGDLSRDAWSVLPGPGDFVAEIHTRRYDTLTYARSSAEPEDITLFDRKHHRNIALYASQRKLVTRGRFYSEDDSVDYDVIDYDIDVSATPDRQWIEGRARVYLKVRALSMSTLTLKLADSLVIQSIVSNEFGRLFSIRVKNQNTVVVNLPSPMVQNSELTVLVSYAGRLEPQTADREALALEQARGGTEDTPFMTPEASSLYSSRSFWYPQSVVSDYATARIRVSVPSALECVASGELEPGFPVLVPAKDQAPSRKLYAFTARQPLRYLAFIVSRFMRSETVTIGFPDAAPAEGAALTGRTYHSASLSVEANPRQVVRGHDLVERAADIALFYESLIGDMPYPSFTIALIENDLPGGHSPAYFAALNQPLPTSPLVWRNDPAAFTNFPDFFIAHEFAHQWWGQAVGWRNYHEQWLSEGFAQYFAALYAQHERGEDVFTGVLRQFRRWGIEQSDQGPVYLGYRLGHIRGEGRVFRALVYNKSAAVLHMLRRLIGDEAFFNGVRRFYAAWRFRKAGTEDLRVAMEAASGQRLERFFERWIYGTSLPKLKFSYRVEGPDVVLRVEQLGEDVFDLPITAVLQYSDRKPVDVIVPVTDRIVEMRVKMAGTLRGVDVSKDDGTLAEVTKG
jgi:hypothetical protein